MCSLREGCNVILPGQYFDGETGLHYNTARDYDPAVGRYVESDPVGQYPDGESDTRDGQSDPSCTQNPPSGGSRGQGGGHKPAPVAPSLDANGA